MLFFVRVAMGLLNHETYAMQRISRSGRVRDSVFRFLRKRAKALRFGGAAAEPCRSGLPEVRGGTICGARKTWWLPGALQCAVVPIIPMSSRWRAEKGYDLTLAGHTHGGPGDGGDSAPVPSMPRVSFTPFVYGLYRPRPGRGVM